MFRVWLNARISTFIFGRHTNSINNVYDQLKHCVIQMTSIKSFSVQTNTAIVSQLCEQPAIYSVLEVKALLPQNQSILHTVPAELSAE